MAKIGERLADGMIDLGRREVGGFFFPDSNIAQPMYPLRGGYEVSKEQTLSVNEPDRSLEDRLQEPSIQREGPEHDDPERDHGIERE